MPKKLDLDTVSPERRAYVLARREAKKREYKRRKDVLRARAREWQCANPDKCAESVKAWAESNPERKAEITRASYDRNRDKVLAREKKRRQDLVDSVVRSATVAGTELRSQDVPDELLPELRNILLVRREVRAFKKATVEALKKGTK